MGDPSGIGPEIILKALSDPDIYRICKPIILGDTIALGMDIPGLGHTEVNPVTSPDKALCYPGKIDLIALSGLGPDDLIPGNPSLRGGQAMVNYIIEAVKLIRNGDLDAMVTCPISKNLMNKAGYDFEGHTQLISHLTGTKDYVMMLAGERLRVTLVSIHCALRDVPSLINEEKVYKTIAITSRSLAEDFGMDNPLIAVAALNPHAGESGLFGSEESDSIIPAINRAKKDGFNVLGPFPSDTLYFKAASGKFDAVVNMYHDQGLIPLKLLHFSDAVNITLGLPIVRTSVDHGTAYDIAGKGEADPSSLKAAIRTAALMVKNREMKRQRARN